MEFCGTRKHKNLLDSDFLHLIKQIKSNQD